MPRKKKFNPLPKEQAEDVIFSRVEDFIEKIQEPTPDYIVRSTGKKYYLPTEYTDSIDKAKTTIVNLTFKTVQEQGFEEVSWRLEESAERVNELTEEVLHGYGEELRNAVSELGEIIKGSKLTPSEQMGLAEQEEFNEGYEEPY